MVIDVVVWFDGLDDGVVLIVEVIWIIDVVGVCYDVLFVVSVGVMGVGMCLVLSEILVEYFV